jgi:hypothetical protein
MSVATLLGVHGMPRVVCLQLCATPTVGTRIGNKEMHTLLMSGLRHGLADWMSSSHPANLTQQTPSATAQLSPSACARQGMSRRLWTAHTCYHDITVAGDQGCCMICTPYTGARPCANEARSFVLVRVIDPHLRPQNISWYGHGPCCINLASRSPTTRQLLSSHGVNVSSQQTPQVYTGVKHVHGAMAEDDLPTHRVWHILTPAEVVWCVALPWCGFSIIHSDLSCQQWHAQTCSTYRSGLKEPHS